MNDNECPDWLMNEGMIISPLRIQMEEASYMSLSRRFSSENSVLASIGFRSIWFLIWKVLGSYYGYIGYPFVQNSLFRIIKIKFQTTSTLHNRDSQVTLLSPSCGTAVTLEWHCCRPRAALWASIRLQQLLPSGCISASIMLHAVSIVFHLCFHRVAHFLSLH